MDEINKLKKIKIIKLFHTFTYEINLNLEENITLIHGPNGVGKTKILELIDGFIHGHFMHVLSIPFEKFSLFFTNNNSVEISKQKNALIIRSKDPKKKYVFDPKKVLKELRSAELHNARILSRFDIDRWYRYDEKTLLNDKEIFDILGDDRLLYPEWLNEIRSSINTHFIKTQRLFIMEDTKNISSIQQQKFKKKEGIYTIEKYSNELKSIISNRLTEYGDLSQKLDRTFPSRIISSKTEGEFSIIKLKDQLENLDIIRTEYIKAGLLDKDDEEEKIFMGQIDQSTTNVLHIYVQDTQKKLKVFKDLYDKINIFRTTIESRFLFKNFSIDKKNGFKFTSNINENNISITDLSSGEQHELILIYEMIFKAKSNSLILIDEPEISLHVEWQEIFLENLEKIIKVNPLYFIIATHSPQIINEKWHLTVKLEGDELSETQ